MCWTAGRSLRRFDFLSFYFLPTKCFPSSMGRAVVFCCCLLFQYLAGHHGSVVWRLCLVQVRAAQVIKI